MDLDPFAELERMAAVANANNSEDPENKEIERWMKLFKYDFPTAFTLIRQHRADVTREPISDEHWDLVKEEREAAGYDREAYEHSLGLKDLMKSQSTTVHDADGMKWILYRMGGLLENAEKIKEIAGLDKNPKVTYGMGSMGEVPFVWLEEEAAKKIESWLEMQRIVQKDGKEEK